VSVLIAIPIYRIACRVGIAKGRAWSVVEEMVLWSMTRQSKSVSALVSETGLQRQIVLAAIARLMRFRLVEVNIAENGATFRASDYGFKAVSSGNPLPVFPKKYRKPVSFVIECVSGEFYHARDVTIMSRYRLDQEREHGREIRVVSVEGGGPSMSNAANLRRLSDIAAGGWNEEIASVDSRTVDVRDNEFVIVRVLDGVPRGLPEAAGATLRQVVMDAANQPAGSGDISVGYTGPKEDTDSRPVTRPCSFDPADLVIGGPQQHALFVDLLTSARRRIIIHSTFLNAARFKALLDPIRDACLRGATIDLLWGAERDEETEQRSNKAAADIARMVSADPDLRGRFRVHMRTTGSHAKFIFLDTEQGWKAAVGSCNWFWSPFRSVEISVVLSDTAILADFAAAVQQLLGRRGLADDIANEMGLTARDLRRSPSEGGTASMAVVLGEAHDQMTRMASGSACKQFFIGCHKLGSTARPGAIMQGELAAGRPGVNVTILYTQPAGPLKNRNARVLQEEAACRGVRLVKAHKTPLHGKIVAWDDDDVVVTSLNWASASADPDFPCADIGIHVHADGVAVATLKKLRRLFPELASEQPHPVNTATSA
jgi:cardiolipin synthase A/B